MYVQKFSYASRKLRAMFDYISLIQVTFINNVYACGINLICINGFNLKWYEFSSDMFCCKLTDLYSFPTYSCFFLFSINFVECVVPLGTKYWTTRFTNSVFVTFSISTGIWFGLEACGSPECPGRLTFSTTGSAANFHEFLCHYQKISRSVHLGGNVSWNLFYSRQTFSSYHN